jgi:hypothetical protein
MVYDHLDDTGAYLVYDHLDDTGAIDTPRVPARDEKAPKRSADNIAPAAEPSHKRR